MGWAPQSVAYAISAILRDRRRLIAALAVLSVVLVRLASAAFFGPVTTPDSAHYLEQAKCIFITLTADAPPCPESVFKSVGYGFVLAAAMIVFGYGWQWGVVALQIGLSFLASFMLARLMLALSGSFALAILMFAMHQLALPLNIDLWILRDSLFASAITIALASCARQSLEPGSPIGGTILLVGALFALGSALREQIIFYGIFFLPLLLLWLSRNLSSRRRIALALVVIITPTVLMQFALKAWNQRMSGLAVVSTNAKTVMSQAVLEVAKKHPDLYDGETLLDQAARKLFVRYDYREVRAINRYLEAQGVSDAMLADLAIAKYVEAWRRYPVDFLVAVRDRFFEEPSRTAFDPARGILMHKGYTESTRYFDFDGDLLTWAWKKRRLGDLILAALTRFDRVASTLLYVLAWLSFLVSSIALFRKRSDRIRDLVIVAMFTFFLGVALAHALVHLEPRQIAGVMWVPLLLGLELPYRLLGSHGRSVEWPHA